MVKYECSVLHIPLKWLELFCDDRQPHSPSDYRTIAMKHPHPFRLLTEIVSRSPMRNLILSEDAHGTPFIAVLRLRIAFCTRISMAG